MLKTKSLNFFICAIHRTKNSSTKYQTWDSNKVIAEPLANVDWSRYGIPFAFIFGIIGCVYHFTRDPKRALAVSILFIVTGIFIILYLNCNVRNERNDKNHSHFSHLRQHFSDVIKIFIYFQIPINFN